MDVDWFTIGDISYAINRTSTSTHLLLLTDDHRVVAEDIDEKAIDLLEPTPKDEQYARRILRNALWQAEDVSRYDGGNPERAFERTYRRSFYMDCQDCGKTALHEQSVSRTAARCLACRGTRVELTTMTCQNCARRTRHADYRRSLFVCTKCGCRRRT